MVKASVTAVGVRGGREGHRLAGHGAVEDDVVHEALEDLSEQPDLDLLRPRRGGRTRAEAACGGGGCRVAGARLEAAGLRRPQTQRLQAPLCGGAYGEPALRSRASAPSRKKAAISQQRRSVSRKWTAHQRVAMVRERKVFM